MRALSLDELCDLVLNAENPLILMHCRPDGDTIGSAAALMHIFRALGREPRALSPDPLPRRLSFITEGLDMTAPDLSRDYTVITVDVASRGQLGALKDTLVGRLAPVLMIDHHERGEAYADHYIRPNAAAAGEIIYELALRMHERGMLPALSQELVNSIFAAISSDTGCFKFSNTTEKTHLAAAHLLSLGADASEINRRLFDIKSLEQLRAEGYVQSHLQIHPSGRIAWTVITHAIRDSLGLLDEHFETAIDIVRALKGIEVAIAIKESPDGRYKASFRSIGLDVAAIAASLGGGGHVRAAGCSLSAPSAEAAAAAVVGMVADALGEKCN